MATRHLANRCIDPVFGAGSTLVDAGKVLPGTHVALAHHSILRTFLIGNETAGVTSYNIFTTTRYTGTEHDRVNNAAIARFAVRSRPPR
jgi:hypothetical protein